MVKAHFPWPVRSTTQIWLVTRHQYGISAHVSQWKEDGKPCVTSVSIILLEKMAHGQLSKLSYSVQNEPVVTLNIFTNFYFDTDFVWQFVGWWYFCILHINWHCLILFKFPFTERVQRHIKKVSKSWKIDLLHSEILILRVYKSLIIPETTTDKTKGSAIYFCWDLVVQPHYQSVHKHNYHIYVLIKWNLTSSLTSNYLIFLMIQSLRI